MVVHKVRKVRLYRHPLNAGCLLLPQIALGQLLFLLELPINGRIAVALRIVVVVQILCFLRLGIGYARIGQVHRGDVLLELVLGP